MKDFYTLADLRNWDAVTASEELPIRLGVFGDPVAHSRSPQMHNAALRASGLRLQYARFQISAEELEPALRVLPSLGFIGVNLTIPHKAAGATLMDKLDAFAGEARAVNCVQIDGNQLIGSNTDGPGFARAIRSDFDLELRDLRILLLGTGGVGRAIAWQCASEYCERLTLMNRTRERASELARQLDVGAGTRSARKPAVEVMEWNEASFRRAIAETDLLVNATALGLDKSDGGGLPATVLDSHLMVYDTVYAAHETALLKAAAHVGARASSGLSMLLHQGALSFERWFNRGAPLDVMQAALAEP